MTDLMWDAIVTWNLFAKIFSNEYEVSRFHYPSAIQAYAEK